jgi:type I restriction-modification system DNA methylase subunit
MIIKRKSKGVYYTPIPVVRFIVERLDYLIRKNFDSNGLKGV